MPPLALIPAAVLGSLLFFSGIELALSAKPQGYTGSDLVVVLAVAAVSVASNPTGALIGSLLEARFAPMAPSWFDAPFRSGRRTPIARPAVPSCP